MLIAAGTAVLALPACARSGHVDLLTALFTSTSAVCVTGLAVVDTGTYWSAVGQVVIMILMELGGLGFMMGATTLAIFHHRRLSLRQRVMLEEIGSASNLDNLEAILFRAVAFTMLCEAVGSIILWIRFAPRFGLWQGLWFGVFHSISAFTNGSFDIMGHGKSFADYQGDWTVLLTLVGLMSVGGLGYVVVQEVAYRRSWRRLSVDSKIVLGGTAVLLLAGTALFWGTEHENAASIGRLPWSEQILNAFFLSAAARTCGFTTWNFVQTNQTSIFFLLGLMFIGGAPGSMAGGIKLTTAAVLLSRVWATIRGEPDATLFERRIFPAQVAQALAVTMLSLLLVINVALVISLIEGSHLHAPFLNLVFEVTSAFGTVGLSVGVTGQLSAASKLLLVLTMFVGRLGPISTAMVLTERRRTPLVHLPDEAVRIG